MSEIFTSFYKINFISENPSTFSFFWKWRIFLAFQKKISITAHSLEKTLIYCWVVPKYIWKEKPFKIPVKKLWFLGILRLWSTGERINDEGRTDSLSWVLRRNQQPHLVAKLGGEQIVLNQFSGLHHRFYIENDF